MSLATRQLVFAFLAFLALIYLIAGLALVYFAPHPPPVLADGSPNVLGAVSDAIQQAAFVGVTGSLALAVFGGLAWRCNVRLREDRYHAEQMRALAALVRGQKAQ